jgi:hypothetical protein
VDRALAAPAGVRGPAVPPWVLAVPPAWRLHLAAGHRRGRGSGSDLLHRPSTAVAGSRGCLAARLALVLICHRPSPPLPVLRCVERGRVASDLLGAASCNVCATTSSAIPRAAAIADAAGPQSARSSAVTTRTRGGQDYALLALEFAPLRTPIWTGCASPALPDAGYERGSPLALRLTGLSSDCWQSATLDRRPGGAVSGLSWAESFARAVDCMPREGAAAWYEQA